MSTIRVPTSRQGQTGMGQGGFTCFQFAESIGEPVTVALRSPIPLETDLDVVHSSDRWHLVDPSNPEVVIMEATRWDPDYASTTPVTVEEATMARHDFSTTVMEHPAPHCISCGVGEDSLRVHAGALGDGRWATPLRIPDWAVSNGTVDMSLLWMAMDCSAAWYISHSGTEKRAAVTVQFAVDVHTPIEPETDYAVVAWNGDYDTGWDGRKRGAAAAVFSRGGTCIAQSRSFWVAR